MLGNWGILRFVRIDWIVWLSDYWRVAVFNRSIKLFSLLIIRNKFSMANLVDTCEIEVFIIGTLLTWLESGIPCESCVSCSIEFLSLSKMLKYIWSSAGSFVITQNESILAEVSLFATNL